MKFRISWETPDGEKSDWIEARSMDAALIEAGDREWVATPIDEAERLMRRMNASINQQNTTPMIVMHHHHRPESLSKSLFGFEL